MNSNIYTVRCGKVTLLTHKLLAACKEQSIKYNASLLKYPLFSDGYKSCLDQLELLLWFMNLLLQNSTNPFLAQSNDMFVLSDTCVDILLTAPMPLKGLLLSDIEIIPNIHQTNKSVMLGSLEECLMKCF